MGANLHDLMRKGDVDNRRRSSSAWPHRRPMKRPRTIPHSIEIGRVMRDGLPNEARQRAAEG
jgi:hypothetical protein